MTLIRDIGVGNAFRTTLTKRFGTVLRDHNLDTYAVILDALPNAPTRPWWTPGTEEKVLPGFITVERA